MTKRIVCVLCALLLSFSAVGCGGPKANQADTDAVNAALEKFSACTSFSVVQLTQTDEIITVEGEKLSCIGISEMELSMITEPEFRMKTTTSAKLIYDGEEMEQSTASYIFAENGGYTEYTSDGNEWYKLSAEEGLDLSQLDASLVLRAFCLDRLSFCNVGEEALPGGKAAHYEGVLAGEELVVMLDSSGYLSGIYTMSENQQAQIIENLVKDLHEVTVSVWVDMESGYPVRFEVDMTELLRELNESIAKTLGNKSSDSGWEMNGCLISMTAGDFDAVEEIVLPSEAASAKLYEAE